MFVKSENPLLNWLKNPSKKNGVHFTHGLHNWQFSAYEDLAILTRRMAIQLRSQGVVSGDRVIIISTASPNFISAFFGTLLVGASPVAAATPVPFQGKARYCKYLEGLCNTLMPGKVIVEDRYYALVCNHIPERYKDCIISYNELSAESNVAEMRECSFSADVIQFTSGSSGMGKGVRVPSKTIAAHCTAITTWLEWEKQDATASWLPLNHDMGLIACFITPIITQSTLWLMQPSDFFRDPLRYLSLFSGDGAKQTAMPTFALEWIIDRVDPSELHELNFSKWRALVVGAEPVTASILERFQEFLAPFGFRRETILPAYGLAEATLAVTGLPLRKGWRAKSFARDTLLVGQIVPEVLPDERQDQALEVVSCGPPLSGVKIDIINGLGEVQKEGILGEIVIEGTSIAAGYYSHNHSLCDDSFENGRFKTGDAGIMLKNELYVLGRFGDSVKIRGRTLFAEDLEALLGEIPTLGRRFGVTVGWILEKPKIVIVLERPNPDVMTRVRRISNSWAEGVDVEIIESSYGLIKHTTSGKIRRKELWQSYVNGEFDYQNSQRG